ncbi:MAG: hypothetical protein ACTSO9_11815 [Candidatus Helarchaeota archaeon]
MGNILGKWLFDYTSIATLGPILWVFNSIALDSEISVIIDIF